MSMENKDQWFMLVGDDDGGIYIIPEYKLAAWLAFLHSPEWDDGEDPNWAVRIDTEPVRFKTWEIIE